MNSDDRNVAEIDVFEAIRGLTTTATKASGDNESDPDDDDPTARLWLSTTTTETAAASDNETDPEDDVGRPRIEALRAMTTTLTESSGDNESDPDDDESGRRVRVDGDKRPIAFRFCELGCEPPPQVQYNSMLQLHVLSDGSPVVDYFRKAVHTH
jgi:hypothetical protein